MNESDYKRRLVKTINKLPDGSGWARRVEDRNAVRVLDMIIKLPGYPMFFAEGKIIRGNTFGPTLGQYEEGMALIKAGVPVILIGWRDGIMYVSSWVLKANRNVCWACQHGDPVESLMSFFYTKNKGEWF